MLLAVDTSTPQIGLALYDGSQVLAETLWTSKARHTVELAPAVTEMLAHTGLNIGQLRALGVAIGPGSFTSLRVGISFIKGLAFALNLPVFGINTLDVVAASQPCSENIPLICSLPAGRNRLAVAWYHGQKTGWKCQGEAKIMTAEDLSKAIAEESLVSGDLTGAERQLLKKNRRIRLVSPALGTRRPAVLAELAYTRWQTAAHKGGGDDLANLAPLYLHIADPIPADSSLPPAANVPMPLDKETGQRA